MGQSSYSVGPQAALPVGSLGDTGPRRVGTYLNDQGAQLPAGIFLAFTAEGKAKLPTASTDQIAGGVLNQYARNPDSLTGTNAVQIGDDMDLIEEGAFWALAEEAMAVTDKVYVRHTTGTGTQLGAIRNDTDTNTARRLSGCRVLRACTAAGPVLVYFSAAADASNL
jgi:hypothetical protein